MNILPSRIHDNKNGLNYTLVGDYYLPDLGIESSQPIGKYGRARMKVLKEQRPGLYGRLLLSGKLYDDLREVDAEAKHLLDEMISQMAAEVGVNEDLKAADPMRWVGMIIPSRHRSRKSSGTMLFSADMQKNGVFTATQSCWFIFNSIYADQTCYNRTASAPGIAQS